MAQVERHGHTLALKIGQQLLLYYYRQKLGLRLGKTFDENEPSPSSSFSTS